MPKISEINEKPIELMMALKAFYYNPRGFFIIAGSNGNGKTFCAKALYECFWHPCSDNLWYTQTDLNLAWQRSLSIYKDSLYLLEQCVKAPLLVLDDLGTRRPTEAFGDFLYAISDKRYEAKGECGTIITTNLSADAMREQFGDAFTSRVSSGVCIRHDGPDRRDSKF